MDAAVFLLHTLCIKVSGATILAWLNSYQKNKVFCAKRDAEMEISMKKSYKEKATQLAKLMNTKSKFSVPIVKVILECFEIAMTEVDLDRLLLVGEKEYTREELQKLWQLDDNEFQEYFLYIMERGVLWPRHDDKIYELSPIFPGWIEIFASGPSNETRSRLIKKFSNFENILKQLNVAPIRAYMNYINKNHMEHETGRMSTISGGSKKIEMHKKLTSEQAIYLSGELYPMLLKHKDHISVMNCFCRMMSMLDGHHCSYDMPLESCIAVGRMSDMLVENGVSKKLSYKEAAALMDNLEKQGCIHTVYHYGISADEDELMICNCCVDCCFLYKGYREGALSQLLMKCYYKPEILDINQCVGCNQCGKYCPTQATWYDKQQKKLQFDSSKCIGCGQCVVQCPKPVRQMVRDERNIFVKTKRKKDC